MSFFQKLNKVWTKKRKNVFRAYRSHFRKKRKNVIMINFCILITQKILGKIYII